jgi:hypothetical protein
VCVIGETGPGKSAFCKRWSVAAARRGRLMLELPGCEEQRSSQALTAIAILHM